MKKEKKYKIESFDCSHVAADEDVVEVLVDWAFTDPSNVNEDPDIPAPSEEHRTVVCPHCGTILTQQRRVDGNS